MKKKIVSGAIAALVIGSCISAAPVVASSEDPLTCVTAGAVGAGQVLTRCPDGFRTGDRRGVSPGGAV